MLQARDLHHAMEIVRSGWCGSSMLGGESASCIGYAALACSCHELPIAFAYMLAGLHAMDGALVELGETQIPAFNQILECQSWKLLFPARRDRRVSAAILFLAAKGASVFRL